MSKASPRDYSFIAPVYDHIFNKPLSEGHREIGKLLNSKSSKKKIKVLEIGVGSGLTLNYLPKNVDFTGIDVNEKMLSMARKKVQKQMRKNVSLEIMDAHALPLKDNTYDLVLAPSVLSAMDSPLKGMREMIRVTKKGGHIAVIANMRANNSMKSQVVRLFDPLTRKFLGFSTDISLDTFTRMRSVKLVENKQVNNLLGFPLSSFLLFEKK